MLNSKALPSQQVVVLAFAFAIMLLHARSSVAGFVEYAWSGTLVPNGAEDPWSIGAAGKPFDIQLRVPSDATADFDPSVAIAGFYLTDVRFRLDGVVLAPSGELFVDFTDNWSNLLEIISFTGYFEQLGQSLEIGTVVVLPTSTFAFTQSLEMPPVFGTATNSDRAVSGGQIYSGVAFKGALVQAVPEGTTIAAIGIATAVIAATSRQRLRSTKQLVSCSFRR